MTAETTDVVVVGAGLAGLRCAAELVGAGLEVTVLEAGDAVGGRIRTDRVDGFLVDRGFQLLNPAYPAVRRWVDVTALRLRPLVAGVAVRVDDGRHPLVELGHPLRAPRLLGATTAAGLRRAPELLAVARWLAPMLRPGRGRLERRIDRAAPDVDLATALDGAHVDGLLRTVLERFLAGVVLDDTLTVSNRFALLLAATFARGVPALPERGMQALPEQLATGLGDRVRLGHEVEAVDGDDSAPVVTTARGRIDCRAVVVATGGVPAARFTGASPPATRGVVTTWWSAPTAPAATSILHVDGRSHASGPLVNTAVVSHAAPSYAPPGVHLVQGSALVGGARDTPTEAEMRRHAGDLYGVGTTAWDVVARHVVEQALPAQPPPYAPRRDVRWGPRRYVCGDHRDTASIQGALVSGHRAARTVLDDLDHTT